MTTVQSWIFVPFVVVVGAIVFALVVAGVLMLIARLTRRRQKPRPIVEVDLTGVKPEPDETGWEGDFRPSPPVGHGLDSERVEKLLRRHHDV